MPNKNFNIILLSSLTLFLFAFNTFLFFSPKYFWEIDTLDSTNPSGEKQLDIYLKGPDAGHVGAVDMRVSVDQEVAKIISAESGGFFQNTILDSYFKDKAVYILATESVTDITKPVVSIRIAPLNNTVSNSNFKLLSSSQIYITNNNSIFPLVKYK